ncbi:MAG: VanW family protein [Myxococcaceae bacterium]
MRALARKVVPVGVRVALLQWPSMLALLRVPRLPTGTPFPHLVTARASPLRRERTAYDDTLQAAKEHNVRRAVTELDGLVLEPGALFSWHRHLGPPLRVLGFADGPELHDERLASGGGGGLCQVANLLFYLFVHGGLTLVERHRHGLDLFPDDARDVPFGCGATVFFPKKDLRFRNDGSARLSLSLTVDATHLRGELRAETPLPFRVELLELHHRITPQADGARTRSNTLFRRWHFSDGTTRDEWLVDNHARVAW